MTTSAERNGATPFAAPAGTPLLGEVITWNASGVSVRHPALVEALRAAGLDEKVARELAPRHAFTRACKKLGERRIIRAVSGSANELCFQFTQESRVRDRFEYTLETLLTLDKGTGAVSCPLPGLASLAQERLDECIAARNGGDVTRVIQRLFEREADLFPIRDRGGCYFVPDRHSAFLDRVGRFVSGLGGSLRRFPVPAGTAHGDRSVKEAVACGLASIIEDHRKAVAAFGEDTREGTLERAAERIRDARFKVEAYGAYLAEEKSKLEGSLSLAASELRAKVESLAAGKEGVTPVTCGTAIERDLLFLSCPALWPAWPMLPVVRRREGRPEELGPLCDVMGLCGRPGHSATVYLCNLFMLPPTLEEFLSLPSEAFDNPEGVRAAGWRVD